MAKTTQNDGTGAPDIEKSGVYRIVCVSSGKIYIGSASRSFRARWGIHLHHLRKGKHHSRHLQSAYNKYGEDSFIFQVVELCEPENCIAREQWHMDELKISGVALMNISPTAGSPLGVRHSEEARRKSSLLRKGIKLSPQRREAIRAGHIGMKYSPEHCDAIRRSKVGKKLPDHWRKSITEGQRRRGKREREERFNKETETFGLERAIELQKKRDRTYANLLLSRARRGHR